MSRKRIGVLFSVLIIAFFFLFLKKSDPDAVNIERTIESPSTSVEMPSSLQTTGKIYGLVKNGKSGKPLQGANIFLFNIVESIGFGFGAASDRDGNYFIINVPPGIYTLKSTYLGFETIKINLVKVQAGKSTNVNFVMKSTIIPLFPKYEEKEIPPPPTPEEGPRVRFIPYDEPPVPPDGYGAIQRNIIYPDSTEKNGIEEQEVPHSPLPPSPVEPIFAPYDEPPMPIGGYAAIQKNIVYPDKAKKNGIEGTVKIKAFIDETGKVSSASVLKGIPNTGLDEAAINAITKTQFKPAKQRDMPIGVWISIPVKFSLPEK